MELPKALKQQIKAIDWTPLMEWGRVELQIREGKAVLLTKKDETFNLD